MNVCNIKGVACNAEPTDTQLKPTTDHIHAVAISA